MSEGRVFILRVKFTKMGRCMMLSHLEVARTLERTIRRAHLPYAISQGFSPHMKIAFGSALPVGIGGACEFYDVQLTEYLAPAKALAALKQASVEDMMALSCEYIDRHAPAASAAYPYGVYEVRFTEDPGKLIVPKTVTVIRKKKEKVLRVSEFLIGNIVQEEEMAWFTLHSKSTGSLRADVLVHEMLKSMPDIGIRWLYRAHQVETLQKPEEG